MACWAIRLVHRPGALSARDWDRFEELLGSFRGIRYHVAVAHDYSETAGQGGGGRNARLSGSDLVGIPIVTIGVPILDSVRKVAVIQTVFGPSPHSGDQSSRATFARVGMPDIVRMPFSAAFINILLTSIRTGFEPCPPRDRSGRAPNRAFIRLVVNLCSHTQPDMPCLSWMRINGSPKARSSSTSASRIATRPS